MAAVNPKFSDPSVAWKDLQPLDSAKPISRFPRASREGERKQAEANSLEGRVSQQMSPIEGLKVRVHQRLLDPEVTLLFKRPNGEPLLFSDCVAFSVLARVVKQGDLKKPVLGQEVEFTFETQELSEESIYIFVNYLMFLQYKDHAAPSLEATKMQDLEGLLLFANKYQLLSFTCFIVNNFQYGNISPQQAFFLCRLAEKTQSKLLLFKIVNGSSIKGDIDIFIEELEQTYKKEPQSLYYKLLTSLIYHGYNLALTPQQALKLAPHEIRALLWKGVPRKLVLHNWFKGINGTPETSLIRLSFFSHSPLMSFNEFSKLHRESNSIDFTAMGLYHLVDKVETERALVYFNQAIKEDPTNNLARISKCLICVADKKYQECAEDFSHLYKSNPFTYQIFYIEYLLLSGNFDEAKKIIAEVEYMREIPDLLLKSPLLEEILEYTNSYLSDVLKEANARESRYKSRSINGMLIRTGTM